MLNNYLLLIGIILPVMIVVVLLKKLTIPASIIGGLIAFIIYTGVGFIGIAFLTGFFILGTSATSWKRSLKHDINVRDDSHSMRKASQVIANAGVGTLAALLAWIDPSNNTLYTLMIAASFASATADTLSSELGSVYGRKFYNIITLQPDIRGLDGVVSVEGTAIGILGAATIALIYVAAFGWSIQFLMIIIAGALGNVVDSILGATLERRGIVKNDAVNFLNTLSAALFAGVFYWIE